MNAEVSMDEASRPSDLDEAVNGCIQALHAHADALVHASDPNDEEVVEAARALASALIRYDRVLVKRFDTYVPEVVGLAEELDEEGEDQEDPELDESVPRVDDLPAGQRVAVMLRTDFVVTDPQRLSEKARAAFAAAEPFAAPQEVQEAVDDVQSAIMVFLHEAPFPLESYGEEHGLLLAGGYHDARLVRRTIQDALLDELWTPTWPPQDPEGT
jgi:hypothetical protein